MSNLAVTANEPLELILSHYPIRVLNIRNESYKGKKGVWWVKTADNTYILKKISNSEQTLKFIQDAVRHLGRNGIRLPKPLVTMDGKEYLNLNGTCYVLTDAIDGKNPSYASPKELAGIVRELARFHKASRGYSPPEDAKPKYHLGIWVEDYREQIEDIHSYYENELVKKEHDAIGKVILAEVPAFYERANKAIAGLEGPEYREWVTQAMKGGALCHQDFAAGNLIMTPNGEMYVIDTDSITIDIPARDIRKLLNKVMKKNGKWDVGLVKTMLSAYQSENPLTAAQWRVVKLDLQFPHLFIGAVNKYMYRRDAEWTDDKYHKRIVEMAGFEKTISGLLDQFESIIPV